VAPTTRAERRRRVLEFIVRFQAHYGYPPTLRQIALGAGLGSVGTAHRLVSRLTVAGYLAHRCGNRQLWTVLRMADELDDRGPGATG
jgi:SOS-response transcriptional repressor LexA